jgi:glycosyltransferase involved in cell wall biosynthesis
MPVQRVLIFVVSFNAGSFIVALLKRIPADVWHNTRFECACLIIEESSTDGTPQEVEQYITQHPEYPLVLLHNPHSQGYGDIQKLGYYYAIQNGFDVVLLLHGDGQYPPEQVTTMVTPILDGETDAVFGSCMIHERGTPAGKMPIAAWVGNRILTTLQNKMLGIQFSEYQSGFRAYSVAALKTIPFANNSEDFDFDTEILIQFLDTQKRIKEIPISIDNTLSTVNGFKYGLLILSTTFLSRLVPYGIFYHPKFDYYADNSYYTPKLGYSSSHQFAIDRVRPNTVVLDLGCGPGFIARELNKKQVRTISVDKFIGAEAKQYSYATVEADVDHLNSESLPPRVDYILLLDIIEHLKSPEQLFQTLRERYGSDGPEIIITTGNIAYIVIRLSLLLGQFNYGKRGILDLDHARLFTFVSLRRLLTLSGYVIHKEQGIPAPFPLALGNSGLGRFLLNLNILLIRLFKGIFAYQIAMVVEPKPTLKHLLEHADSQAKKTERHFQR